MTVITEALEVASADAAFRQQQRMEQVGEAVYLIGGLLMQSPHMPMPLTNGHTVEVVDVGHGQPEHPATHLVIHRYGDVLPDDPSRTRYEERFAINAGGAMLAGYGLFDFARRGDDINYLIDLGQKRQQSGGLDPDEAELFEIALDSVRAIDALTTGDAVPYAEMPDSEQQIRTEGMNQLLKTLIGERKIADRVRQYEKHPPLSS
ncbi:MAG: hypothetical protein ACREGB_05150 [Candidatus Saccharimonadales bacterium]